MGTNSSPNNNKQSTWLLNWFNQLGKPSTTKETSNIILPWKRDNNMKAAASSFTTPINVPCSTSSFDTSSTSRNPQGEETPRPSITISLSPNERRNSQQTTCSSIRTAESQYSFNRRDSNSDRSILSELWSKARRRHPHYPKFHWPHSNNRRDETQQVILNNQQPNDYQQDSSLPSSFRQHHFPRHLKRHSISSSLVTTNDNTPFGSRPNSILYPSQPASPNMLPTSHLSHNESVVDAYWLQQPTDRLRWNIKHELAKLAVDGLFFIPELVTQQKSTEKQILQIGCGDASWGIDVATQHSRWNVTGLHDDYITSSIRASNSVKNFKFMQCVNLLQGLKEFPDHSFDFIASRFLILAYTFRQYQELVRECVRIAKPGAFIEVVEMDLRIYHHRLLSCTITQLLNSEVFKVIESKGLDPRLARNLQDLITQEDMHSEIKYISLPLGVWGGKLGVLFRDDVHTLIESFQKEIAQFKEKQERTEDELEYKTDIMDMEMDSNRAFMNLHLMVIHV
ncbi:uncharacterized protein EV154DRAFT_520377 [Mucor mucedo]|uniref:uncharacterized protein n=1 Tax=Mucor mucedo TaxID=29922 RepID=UPI00221EE8A2|nr:uncharacterized protein EV154DRAFT_520377 [Mucor mucedo]KAI7887669.1 hypothetical protein EV154DRAFT_520377 [Mucor mucedo]